MRGCVIPDKACALYNKLHELQGYAIFFSAKLCTSPRISTQSFTSDISRDLSSFGDDLKVMSEGAHDAGDTLRRDFAARESDFDACQDSKHKHSCSDTLSIVFGLIPYGAPFGIEYSVSKCGIFGASEIAKFLTAKTADWTKVTQVSQPPSFQFNGPLSPNPSFPFRILLPVVILPNNWRMDRPWTDRNWILYVYQIAIVDATNRHADFRTPELPIWCYVRIVAR